MPPPSSVVSLVHPVLLSLRAPSWATAQLVHFWGELCRGQAVEAVGQAAPERCLRRCDLILRWSVCSPVQLGPGRRLLFRPEVCHVVAGMFGRGLISMFLIQPGRQISLPSSLENKKKMRSMVVV